MPADRFTRNQSAAQSAMRPDRCQFGGPRQQRVEKATRCGRDFDGTGRINADLFRQTLPFDAYDFYMCGPPPFMQGLYDQLSDLGIPDARIHAEAFGPATLKRREPEVAAALPPAARVPVPVAFAASGKEARWEPDAGTLLDLAEARGLGAEPIELVSAGLRPSLRATLGFSVMPDALVGDLDLGSFDALAVPGGFAGAGFYEDALSEPFLAVIRHFEARGKWVASVCVASLALGAAGVLQGRRATTCHQVGGQRKAQLEAYGAQFVDEAIVIDGTLMASTGPGTGVEVAFALLRQLTSAHVADRIRTLMRVPRPQATWQIAPQVAAA